MLCCDRWPERGDGEGGKGREESRVGGGGDAEEVEKK